MASDDLKKPQFGIGRLQQASIWNRKASRNLPPFLSLDRKTIVILLSGGGSRMVHKTLNEALEDAARKLMDAENTLNTLNTLDSAESCRYAKTVYAAFDRIRALQEKGIRLIRICKAFEESGLLPRNANPRCFCQAFRREKTRRGKNINSPVVHAATPKLAQTAARPDEVASKETEKEERIKKQLTGAAVKTKPGDTIRRANGSFDF
jgi:hypothetical protein